MKCECCGSEIEMWMDKCPKCYGAACPICNKPVLRTESYSKNVHDKKEHLRCQYGPQSATTALQDESQVVKRPKRNSATRHSANTSSWAMALNH